MSEQTNVSDTTSKKDPDKAGLERAAFFSDAVFAIAITLLSLEIQLPVVEGHLTNAELWRLLGEIWPKYLAYGISFLVIGLFWIGHHRKFSIIKRFDGNLLMLNLLMLMAIAFIPFPTSLLSKYGNQTATIFYALVIVLTGLLSVSIWWYASYKNRLIDPNLSQEVRKREVLGPLLVIGIFLLSIVLALFNSGLAKSSWILVALTIRVYQLAPHSEKVRE
jgi:uncharacterized membrane protein